MAIYLDTNTSLGTWRLIADAGNYEVFRGRAARGDTIIRWGANHGRWQGHYPAGVRILNPRLMLSKIQQAAAFALANVPHPTTYRSRVEWTRAGSPIVVVKPDVGQMGTGVSRTSRPIFPREHLTQEFIDKEHEYRAMMVNDIIAFFMEKHPPANGDFRWNEHRGSEWSSVPENRRLRTNVRDICSRALAAIEYDFGAVDVISRGSNLYVLEVNSRPEFGETNASRFVHAIEDFLNRR